jgi:predicted RNA-binding Zn-ribbon protein involved in translation (DUF1610 family)
VSVSMTNDRLPELLALVGLRLSLADVGSRRGLKMPSLRKGVVVTDRWRWECDWCGFLHIHRCEAAEVSASIRRGVICPDCGQSIGAPRPLTATENAVIDTYARDG